MPRLLLVLLICLAACAPRGRLVQVETPGLAGREIYLGTTRAADSLTGDLFSIQRSDTLRLARMSVSVPPSHRTGQIEQTPDDRGPDPNHDFVLTESRLYRGEAGFRADLARSLAAHDGHAVVFTHGYNTNLAEGVYRLAQLGHDFALQGVLVSYDWPSRGSVLGYAYDRDSALFARDGLQQLLDELTRAGARDITLVGHSMGALLTMEALRQMAIGRDRTTLSRIHGVVLISPDIDVDVFHAQARAIGTLPQPFIIFTSERDKALRLSAQISGETQRLGSLADLERISDLDVTVVDTGAFSVGEGHFNLGNSPELIPMIRSAQQIGRSLEREGKKPADLFSGTILTVRNATRVILSPVAVLNER